jgi:amino acid adenylation domain-containing protein/non-ribosomal peptide synthase protein (TIGR01720 family)
MIREGYIFPASFAQQRLWFLEQLEPSTGAYNIPVAYRLRGRVHPDALEQSLTQIVHRHEVLRTSFGFEDGKAVQIVSPQWSPTVQPIDLHHLSTASREIEAHRFVSIESRRPFDLSRLPLLRVFLIRLGEEDYILLIIIHHIVSDGWSITVLLRELSVLYKSFLQNRSSPLPDLPVQYADFSVWQRECLQGQVLEAQLAYWRRQLVDLPSLDLPSDHLRPAVQTYRGARQALWLSGTTTKALKELSRRQGVSLFMALLAVFKTMLYRYTSQHDIVLGTPIAGRERMELEGMVGLFVNTLVLRTDLSGDPPFSTILGRVREVALQAYEHQDVPFEKLVEELEVRRELSRSPLFQIMFALQNSPRDALKLTGLAVSPLQIGCGPAKFDLSFSIIEESKGLRGSLDYNTDLFDFATIAGMIRHFQTLVEGVLANPAQRLSGLPVLTHSERHQLLLEWNDSRIPYPQDRCIHQLFEVQAERTPEAVALVFNGEQLTYRELNDRANQLAHYLRKHGVGPEVRVGICVERSLEMVIGQLGILKAGGAYVPLDPTYPKERLAFMLADAQVHTLVTNQWLAQELSATIKSRIEDTAKEFSNRNSRMQVRYLDTEWEAIARESLLNPNTKVLAENLAYVIYTSGSSGRPKGVQTQHSGVVNLMLWLQRAHGVTPNDRATQLVSPAFDASVWELWPYLASGASVHIADEETLTCPSRLLRWLADQRISICFIPTPLAEAVLDEEWPKDLELRALLTGGDRLHRSPRKVLPCKFVNKYGPTENSAVTTWATISTGIESDVPPTIGRPIDNTHVYVLDRQLNPVPARVVGELFIGGVGLARGYLDRPELTAEKFIPNPFSEQPGARLYRSGDLGRYLPDGNIEFLGRIDGQVKIRGYRIELGEIEAVLKEHPGIGDAVVIAWENESHARAGEHSNGSGENRNREIRNLGSKRLVAYCVLQQEPRPTIAELCNFLRDRVPEYMVPANFVMMDALPLTSNGKVDRRALPAPDSVGRGSEGFFAAPRSRVEKVLARIWAEVLTLERVGIHENFFELGGDSILSIQVIARANQAGLQLTPRQIFQHQTIAELATFVRAIRARVAEQGPVTGSVPLTPIQHWFFEHNLANPHHWNTAMLLQARRALEPNLLKRAVHAVVQHHDALRLRFLALRSGWQQTHARPDEEIPFSRVDLSELSEAEQATAIEETAARLQASLNLSNGPLLRIALFELGSSKLPRLLIIIHHLAMDGVSWRILLEDLQVAYQQLSRGEAILLPSKTTSFKNWADRLAEYARSNILQAEQEYWLAQDSAEIVPLPRDYLSSANTEASARTVAISLSVEETRMLLQEIPKVYDVRIDDLLLTALTSVLARWTGQRSLLISLEGHGREEIFGRVDLSRTVGWFTTIYPVLLTVATVMHPLETLKKIKEQLHAVPNQGIGYGLLRYLSGETTIAAKLQCQFQPEVSFNYLGQFDQVFPQSSLLAWTGQSIGHAHSPKGSRRHLLSINGKVIEHQLQLVWIYSSNLHRRSTVQGLACAYLDILRSFVNRAV